MRKKVIFPGRFLLMFFGVFLISLFLMPKVAMAANCTWSNTSGDQLMSTAANWVGPGCTAISTDNFSFDGAVTTTDANWDAGLPVVNSIAIGATYTGTITLGADATSTLSVAFLGPTSAVLNLNSNDLVVGADLTIGGGVLTTGTGTITMTGLDTMIDGGTNSIYNLTLAGTAFSLLDDLKIGNTLTINSGATLALGANGLLASGAIANSGNITQSASSTILTGSATVGGTGRTQLFNVTINNSNTITAGGDLIISGALTVASGATLGTDYGLTISGAISNSGDIAQSTSSTILTGSVTVGGTGRTQLFDVTINNSNTITAGGEWVTRGTVTVAAGSTLALGANGLEASGVIANSGNITQSASSTILTGSATVGGTGRTQLFNVTINNSNTITAGGDLVATGAVTVAAGSTLALGANGLVASAAISNAGTITQSASSTIMTGTADLGGAGLTTLYNLTVDGTTVTLAGNVTTTNSLTISTGKTFRGSSYTIILSKSSGIPLVENGTFTANTSVVNYTGTGAITIASTTYSTLTLGAGTYTLDGDATTAVAFTNAGALTISSGVNLVSSGTFDNNGTITETGVIKHALTSAKLTNSAGTEVSSYNTGSATLYVTVQDNDGNLSSSTLDTITGSVITANDGTSDIELLTLTETGVDTGVFRASFSFTKSAVKNSYNSHLEVNGAGNLSLAFTDSKDNTDTGSDTASYSGSSLGSGGSSDYTGDVTPPSNTSIVIFAGATSTASRIVSLTLGANDASSMAISNVSDFTSAFWENYNTSKSWTLTENAGVKTVYVKFRDANNNVSSVISDNITLEYPSTEVEIEDIKKVEEEVKKAEETEQSKEPLESAGCELTPGLAYKEASKSAVYYITTSCTKRAFVRSDVFYTYFDSWDDVKVTTKATLEGVADDTLGFMPWGPKYDPKYGALVKIVTDPEVYLLLGTERYWITSEDVFNTLNYDWGWIEDVDTGLLAKYDVGSEITYTDHHPNYTIVKYASSPKVYRLEPDSVDLAKQVKRHIENEAAFNALNFRWDRIVTIDDTEVYADGEVLIK